MRGIGCCASAASGHATAPPLTSMMNSRRCIGSRRRSLCNSERLPFCEQTASPEMALIALRHSADQGPGHWQTSQGLRLMSALTPKTDVLNDRPARLLCAKTGHSISLSADAITESGICRPRVRAVFKLITVSNFVGRSIGNSDGAVPLRTRST
jgi:hypothetical protein